MIQLFKPSIGPEEIAAVKLAMETGWLGLGPHTAEFESRFADYVGARYAIGTNSGTAALHLAIMAYGIGPGDEVIVPALTCVSTVNAIRYVGATPVFADVLEDTLCIDANDVSRKVTAHTRAIIPVHYGGHPCDLDELHALADGLGILVIEDAAHACGAAYRGRRIGGLSQATCFSFHALKNLTTGEGGAVTTNDPRVDETARRLRIFGINKDSASFSPEFSDLHGYGWYFEVAELGYKYYLNDIGAAIGMVQLARLEETNARRRLLARRYSAGLASVPWVDTRTDREYVLNASHMYVIATPHRDRLHVHLRDHGIATGVHYLPAQHHPLYRDYPAVVPVTDRVWLRLLTLPLYPDLTEADVDYVVSTIRNFQP